MTVRDMIFKLEQCDPMAQVVLAYSDDVCGIVQIDANTIILPRR